MAANQTARVVLLIASVAFCNSSPSGQTPAPSLNTSGAKDHVGEVATVCGHVVDYSCRQPNSTTLTFAPAADPSPFTVQREDPDGSTFGRRPEERLLNRIACVRGKIEQLKGGIGITIANAELLKVVTELTPGAAPFAPDAHSSCEPGVVLPVVVHDERPAYTGQAIQNKIHGTVWMRGVVNADGTVGDMQVMRGLDPGLDVEALRAFRKWRFKPGTYAGQPAPIVVFMSMTFTLRK